MGDAIIVLSVFYKSTPLICPKVYTFLSLLLEKAMATHSGVLAWRIPGTGELGGLPLWGRTESDMTDVT